VLEESLQQAGKAPLAGQAEGFMLFFEEACAECRPHLFQNKRFFSFAYILLMHKSGFHNFFVRVDLSARRGGAKLCAACLRHLPTYFGL
jgi:hypothetical protein